MRKKNRGRGRISPKGCSHRGTRRGSFGAGHFRRNSNTDIALSLFVDPSFLQDRSVRPEETEAMWLVWEHRGHSRSEEIPEADAVSILAEIRARADAYERRVLGTLKRTTSESRRYPRKHMVFALVVVLPLAILMIVVIAFLMHGFG